MIRLLILVVVVVLIFVLASGCTQPVPVPSVKLAEPAPRLMLDIPDLPPVKAGDDIYRGYGVCRAEYGNVKSVATGLQGYVRVIHQQKQ